MAELLVILIVTGVALTWIGLVYLRPRHAGLPRIFRFLSMPTLMVGCVCWIVAALFVDSPLMPRWLPVVAWILIFAGVECLILEIVVELSPARRSLVQLNAELGGWVIAGYRFRYGGTKYQATRADMDALSYLARLTRVPAEARRNPGWLLPHRREFRQIIRRRHNALLAYVAGRSPSDDLRRLAIWLLGRCRGPLGTTAIAPFGADPQRVLRKEVVRALKRMDGWAELRQIASSETDPVIRAMACPPAPRSYADRLSGFLGDVAPHPVDDEPKPLVLTDHYEPHAGRPPKPAWLIRYWLERIRWWVAMRRR